VTASAISALWEEGGKPASTEDGQTEIGGGAYDDQRQS
jgi:hypothetical protein